jgi:hypothetical protein
MATKPIKVIGKCIHWRFNLSFEGLLMFKTSYRAVLFAGLFGCFRFTTLRFFLFAPGAELGGRTRTPGIELGVIPNAMVSSFIPFSYYITGTGDYQRRVDGIPDLR